MGRMTKAKSISHLALERQSKIASGSKTALAKAFKEYTTAGATGMIS